MEYIVEVRLRVRVATDGHLQEVKDTVSLAVEHLQEELDAEGVVVSEGEWKVLP